jgi:hypothetical protein
MKSPQATLETLTKHKQHSSDDRTHQRLREDRDRPLGAFYRDAILPNWGFFRVLLTVAELAIGVGLLLGIATRGSPPSTAAWANSPNTTSSNSAEARSSSTPCPPVCPG